MEQETTRSSIPHGSGSGTDARNLGHRGQTRSMGHEDRTGGPDTSTYRKPSFANLKR